MNDDDAAAAMGKALLEGWRMMADVCPLCSSPLCSSPKAKGGEVWCLRCKLPCSAPGSDKPPPSLRSKPVGGGSSAAPPSTPAAPPLEPSEPALAASPFAAVAGGLAGYRARRDESSAKIGQRMLQGWTLLGDTCPSVDTCTGIPLMSKPAGKARLCVSCERFWT